MIILLNGPLGIGKTTLAEALTERVQRCVMINGDFLVEVNPPPRDEVELLHSTVALLVTHYRRFGYCHFVVDHIWTEPGHINDLRRRLTDIDSDFRSYLLTLPAEQNMQRIKARARACALSDLEQALRIAVEERAMLMGCSGAGLGQPFDVSEPPPVLAKKLLRLLDIPMSGIAISFLFLLHPLLQFASAHA